MPSIQFVFLGRKEEKKKKKGCEGDEYFLKVLLSL